MSGSAVLDVGDWGADPDRVDNQSPINQCLAEAKAQGLAVSLSAMFPVSDRVLIPGGVRVVGASGSDSPCGLRATWTSRSDGPPAVVSVGGRGAVVRNVVIEGAHDGTPTGKAGADGVTGLLVQGANNFTLDRVVATHHSQMGIRIVRSSHGRVLKPTVEFCGRDGITLYGQGDMTDIEIVDAVVRQTGDDGIAVWDGAARFDVPVQRGSIEAGSVSLTIESSAGVEPGHPVVVDGAGAEGTPLLTEVATVESSTVVTVAVAARSTVSGPVVVGFRPPQRIRVVNAVIDQSPVHRNHPERNGRGIVLGGAHRVTIEGARIRNSVSMGLQLRHGSMAGASDMMWNKDIVINDLRVVDTGHDWPKSTMAAGAVVLGRTVGLVAKQVVVRGGAGHGLVLRDLVDAEIDGGACTGNRQAGIVGLERSRISEVTVRGIEASANGKAGVADPAGKLRLDSVKQEANGGHGDR